MSVGETRVTVSSDLVQKEKVAIKCHLIMGKLYQVHHPDRLVLSGHEKLASFPLY